MTSSANPAPDLFTNVHKGIRKALFDLVLALGRADGAPDAAQPARAPARDVVRFLRQHGANEDALIVPLLATRAPDVARAIEGAHRELDAVMDAFEAMIDGAPAPALHAAAAHLTSVYLEHMRVEEIDLEPRIRSVLTDDELRSIGAQSIARTPEDQRPTMLAFVLAAIPATQAEAHLAKLPPELAARLRARRA